MACGWPLTSIQFRGYEWFELYPLLPYTPSRRRQGEKITFHLVLSLKLQLTRRWTLISYAQYRSIYRILTALQPCTRFARKAQPMLVTQHSNQNSCPTLFYTTTDVNITRKKRVRWTERQANGRNEMVGNTGRQRQKSSYLGRDERAGTRTRWYRARRTEIKRETKWKKQRNIKNNKLQREQNYMCKNK